MFKFCKPIQISKMKKSPPDALQRLRNFLDNGTDEPIRFLARFWKDQQDAITYKEIEESIKNGNLTRGLFHAWQQDYCKIVTDKMQPIWTKAMQSGAWQTEEKYKDYTFVSVDKEVSSWIRKQGSKFITNSTIEQRDAVNAIIARGNYLNMPSIDLARYIRPCIGLTKPQINANMKYYEHVKKTLIEAHPRVTQQAANEKAREASIKYASRQQRERAYSIALTESATAYNMGYHVGMKQAQMQGLVGELERFWTTSGDTNVCKKCRLLNGMKVGMDDLFVCRGIFNGMVLTPPAHPRCACVLTYKETGKPFQGINTRGTDFLPIVDAEKLPVTIVDRLQEELNLIPEKHRDILKKEINAVQVIPEGNSKFNSLEKVIYLRKDFEKGEALHEVAHAVEIAFKIYGNVAFIKAIKQTIGEFNPLYDIITDSKTFVKPIQRLQYTENLISIYQGRIYEEVPLFDEDMVFNYGILGDFFAEAYKIFLLNPKLLKKKQRAVYDFIKCVVKPLALAMGI